AGNKELEPLKYSQVATATGVSRRKVQMCVEGTTALFSICLAKGENIALVLRDLGVLVIEGTKVTMKFYQGFLESLAGKENVARGLLQVPQLLDTVVDPTVAVASLTFSGRVIIFP
ncbi:CCD81 protein, partial [Halcyon senegalensis]|nr:CCD81 protein [Halcyon senegalensis]